MRSVQPQIDEQENINNNIPEEKNEEDYKADLHMWLREFIKEHLAPIESLFTEFQRKCFCLEWHDSRPLIAPDITGSMIRSVM